MRSKQTTSDLGRQIFDFMSHNRINKAVNQCCLFLATGKFSFNKLAKCYALLIAITQIVEQIFKRAAHTI